MPKISAETVVEHREAVLSSLMDGAQRILLGDAGRKLTASAVAAEAGIARNSIYRYVSSIDDLVDLVLARGFAEWAARVADDVAAAEGPRDAVIAYVRSNLTQAAEGEHALQQSLAGHALSDSARERIAALHEQISAVLHTAVVDLDPADPDLLEDAVQALVDTMMRRVAPGEPADRVIAFACASAAALLGED
ncbi:TetR family transcriptional regulator [Gordonia spumicola]|uniref:TetR family transcriptional regulator n=1 Tax=Gordonia spumicola TaxID=589161 RepID=A0A7I9V5R5_9ACTN|nr:TetR/AcrR family transcriptional regulator [Gordonia spumicola]GEE00544.1 TetR family transcriptional regulator [Gordonia spumicola]